MPIKIWRILDIPKALTIWVVLIHLVVPIPKLTDKLIKKEITKQIDIALQKLQQSKTDGDKFHVGNNQPLDVFKCS